MYKTAQGVATFFVVSMIATLIVTALYVGWWALLTVPLAVLLGVFAHDVVDFVVNTLLGIPAGPRHKIGR